MVALALIVCIGLLGGIAIGLQGPLSSAIGQRLGMLESIFIVHLGGLVAAGIGLACLGGGKLGQWQSLSALQIFSGVLGVVVVGSTIYNVPRIGVAAAITLIITGQLCTGALVDHFGALGVERQALTLQRVMGLGVVLFGVWLTLRRA
jgi:transporter family-2 protein